MYEALQFELSKVETRDIRLRMLAHLGSINTTLATQIALGLVEEVPSGTKAAALLTALPPVATNSLLDFSFEAKSNQVPTASGGLHQASALSMATTSKNSIKSRKVAILIASGVASGQVQALKTALDVEKATPILVAPQLGIVKDSEGQTLVVDKTFANSGSVFFDAIFIPGGESVAKLVSQDEVIQFVHEAYKHGKAIGAIAEGLKRM
jgi:catalase